MHSRVDGVVQLVFPNSAALAGWQSYNQSVKVRYKRRSCSIIGRKCCCQGRKNRFRRREGSGEGTLQKSLVYSPWGLMAALAGMYRQQIVIAGNKPPAPMNSRAAIAHKLYDCLWKAHNETDFLQPPRSYKLLKFNVPNTFLCVGVAWKLANFQGTSNGPCNLNSAA